MNAMWIIKKLITCYPNDREKAISSYVCNYVGFFDTLFSILHEKLKHHIHELLDKTYAVRRKSFITTDNFRTFWTDEKKQTNKQTNFLFSTLIQY